ncbi:MAG: hypothetical protein ABSD78_03170 [Acidimicrobiales bacterium]|jgi:alpha-tubulin suppressor-like RCC1 family protein
MTRLAVHAARPAFLLAIVIGTAACSSANSLSSSSQVPTSSSTTIPIGSTSIPSVPSVNQVFSWGAIKKGGPVCKGNLCYAKPQPSQVVNITRIDAANTFNLALVAGGRVEAWGQNSNRELGDGQAAASPAVPVSVHGLSNVVQTATGNHFSLALLSNRTVMAWGNNGRGQLGTGNTHDASTPVAVPGLTGVVALAAGGDHSVALLSDGTVEDWGENTHGQLGDGSTKSQLHPVPVTGLRDVIAISAGNLSSDALLANGSVEDWGYNKFGQLGDGTDVDSSVPVLVHGLTDVVQISAGGNLPDDGQTMALLSNGTAVAWGDNASGQLGDGSTQNSDVPVPVTGLSDLEQVAAGGDHSMALGKDGTVWCWGDNSDGQVGDGTLKNALLPVKVMTGVFLIAAGSLHSLALVGKPSTGKGEPASSSTSADVILPPGFPTDRTPERDSGGAAVVTSWESEHLHQIRGAAAT